MFSILFFQQANGKIDYTDTQYDLTREFYQQNFNIVIVKSLYNV